MHKIPLPNFSTLEVLDNYAAATDETPRQRLQNPALRSAVDSAERFYKEKADLPK